MAKKNEGKIFEDCLKKSINQDLIYFYRLKDSTSGFSGGNTSYSVSNDYDFIAFYKRTFFAMELKSTKQTAKREIT